MLLLLINMDTALTPALTFDVAPCYSVYEVLRCPKRTRGMDVEKFSAQIIL